MTEEGALYWQVLEDGGAVHRIALADLKVGQRVLIVSPTREFTATVTAINGDVITLQEFPDAPGYFVGLPEGWD